MTPHGALAVLERETSDETLVERVRQGDDAAFGELYRRHLGVAVAVARKLVGSNQDAEDAAAEAFTNVLSALRRQVGPREMFRPYLLTCVRNTCLLRLRQRSQQACTRDRSVPDVESLDDDKVVEGAVTAAAFRSIPARFQTALWMAEVEHLDPITIAERLDCNVPAAGALVYRARQRFTEAYLSQHLRSSGQPACVALGPKLAQYVRGTAGLIASRQVEHHIEECASCTAALAELSDLNGSLRSIAGPLSIVSAIGATATATATATVGISGMAASGMGVGWLVKAAVVAVLSLAPVVAADDGPTASLDAKVATTGITSDTPDTSDPAATTGAGSGRVSPARIPGRQPGRAGSPHDDPAHTSPTQPGAPAGTPTVGVDGDVAAAIDPADAVGGIPVGDHGQTTLPNVGTPSVGEVVQAVEEGSVVEPATTGLVTVLSTLPVIPPIQLPALPLLPALPAITLPDIPALVTNLPVPVVPTLTTLPVLSVVTVPTLPPLPSLPNAVTSPSLPPITVPPILQTPLLELPGLPGLLGGRNGS